MLKPKEVAEELTKLDSREWEVSVHETYGWGERAEIRLKEGQHFFMNYNDRLKKLAISGGFGIKTDYGSTHISDKRMSIGVSPSKTPLQMAKDINRRLSPQYFDEFEKALKKHESWETYRKQRLETLHNLASIIGTEPKLKHDSDRFYGNSQVREVLFGFNEIELKLSVSHQQAVKILSLIANKD